MTNDLGGIDKIKKKSSNTDDSELKVKSYAYHNDIPKINDTIVNYDIITKTFTEPSTMKNEYIS